MCLEVGEGKLTLPSLMGAELGEGIGKGACESPVWVHLLLGAGKQGGRCRLVAGGSMQEEGKTDGRTGILSAWSRNH